MNEFLSHFDRFICRTFDFRSRATAHEFWVVIPLVWAVFFYFLAFDLYDIWRILLIERVPPLNPFFCQSVFIFALIVIPSLSLTTRRFHDLGRSTLWLCLPLFAGAAIVLLTLAFFGAMMNSGMTGLAKDPNAIASIALPIQTFLTNPDGFWAEMSLVAKAIQSNGWSTISRLLGEVYHISGVVGLQHSTMQIVTGTAGYPEAVVFGTVALVATPLVAFGYTFWIMALPSSLLDNAFGPAKLAKIRDRIENTARSTNTPMSGYAHLFRETQEERALALQARKQELQELYRRRVLNTVGPARKSE